jgi:hypothetical protein
MSAIDPTKPASGAATTQSVRDNFSAAASEIDSITSRLDALEAVVFAPQAMAWDRNNAGTGINWTNSDSTMAETRGGWTACRALGGYSSAKHQVGLIVNGSWTVGANMGILPSTPVNGTPLNIDLSTASICYGIKPTNSTSGACSMITKGTGTYSGSTPSVHAGDIFTFAADFDAHTLDLYQNGSYLGQWSGIEAITFYPAGAMYDFAVNVSVENSMTYPVSGFTQWTPNP